MAWPTAASAAMSQSRSGSALMASCTRCTAACRWRRCTRNGDSSGSRGERRRYTTMSSATLAASASPHSSAIRCSARSMPAVMPALDASGPSTTNTRLSITCARGASARSARSSSWCVVQRRRVEQAGPRREQRARADREQAVRRVRARAAVRASVRFSHCAVAAIAGVTWPSVRARLADQHDPGRRAQRSRQRLEVGEREARRRSAAVATGPAKRRRKRGGSPRALAMQVGQAERFRRPGDVEQQRVRRDDEQQVDQMGACDHFRTWRTAGRCSAIN